MNTDFIPHQDGKLNLWCINYKTQIGLKGKELGLADEEIAQQQALCDLMIVTITEAAAKKAAQVASVQNREMVFKNQFGGLRKKIAHLKTNLLVTIDVQKLLGIAPIHNELDDTNYKGNITAEIYAGVVRLKFKKLGADGVNMYHRKKGDLQWIFLGRFTKSPYDDHIVLATPGQPEHWEYRSFGVIDDKEIGQPSDIVEIVFGG